MIRASNSLALWLCGALFFSGCLSAEARTSSSPPQKSSLRELARIQTKSSLERDPTFTQDGAYYTDAEGIHKIDFAGVSKLFIAWSQIPDFWKTWQDSVHGAFTSQTPTLPPVYKMADESLVIGDIAHFEGDSKGIINLQHISRTGTPLRHFQFTLSSSGYSSAWFVGLEKSRVLMTAYYGYDSFESDIIDLKAGTLVTLEQAFQYERPKKLSASGGQVFALFDVSDGYGGNRKQWAVSYDLSGKIIEKQNLANLVSLKSSDYELNLGSLASLGSGVTGLWIFQFEGSSGSQKESCNLYAIGGNQFSGIGLNRLYREETGESYKCNSHTYIWLGEGNIARWGLSEQTRQKTITLRKMTDKDSDPANTMILDWRYDWSNAQRTQDGSLALLGIPNLTENYPKLQLINPDGQERLTYTFDFKLLSPSEWTPTYTTPTLIFYGPYMT
ncbi:MAG: hypothetical protein ACJ763_11630, partial [Bdellovibrionia bacterium]